MKTRRAMERQAWRGDAGGGAAPETVGTLDESARSCAVPRRDSGAPAEEEFDDLERRRPDGPDLQDQYRGRFDLRAPARGACAGT